MIPAASSSSVRRKPNPLFSVSGKCFVSGCPNRTGSLNRGASNGTPKRFFSFPTAPERVKVWLAALRETDKDPSEQRFICEDHFLPEDISGSEVSSDAIPIMPPYLDGPDCPVGPWSADPFQEEEQWSGGGWDDEEEDEEEPSEPQQQDAKRAAEDPSEPDVTSGFCPEKEPADWFIREGTPLTRLTRGFLELLMADPDASVEVGQAARSLQTHARRVHVVVEVLRGIGLVQRDSDNRVRWIGSSPIFSFLWRDTLTFLTALQRLKAMEEEVDRLFSSCAQQLFALIEDEENSALAYVRCEDVCRLGDLGQQTAIVIRSPPETKLVIPPPEEEGIRMLLKSKNGPISAVTCDVGPLTPEASSRGRVFSALEGRVRVYTLNEAAVRKRMS